MKHLLVLVAIVGMFLLVGCGEFVYQRPGDLQCVAYGSNGYLAVGHTCSMVSKDSIHWQKIKGSTFFADLMLYWHGNFMAITNMHRSIMVSTDGVDWRVAVKSEYYLSDLLVVKNQIIGVSAEKGLLVSDDAEKWHWIEVPVFRTLSISRARLIKGRLYLFGYDSILVRDGKKFRIVKQDPSQCYPSAKGYGERVFYEFLAPDAWHAYVCDEVGGSNCSDLDNLPGGIHVQDFYSLLGEGDKLIMRAQMVDRNGRRGRYCYRTSDGTWALCNLPEKTPDGKRLEISCVKYINGRFIAVGRRLLILASPDGALWSLVNYDPGKKVFEAYTHLGSIFDSMDAGY